MLLSAKRLAFVKGKAPKHSKYTIEHLKRDDAVYKC